MSRRTGLGRGLAALIPPSQPEADEDEQEPGQATQDHEPSEVAPAEDPDVAEGADPDVAEGTEPAAVEGAEPEAVVHEAIPETPEPATEAAAADEPTRSREPAAADGVTHAVAASDTDLPSSLSVTVADLTLDAIVPNPRQPREVFDEEEIEGLAVSLQDVGMLQPVVVRPLSGGRYELVAGERRLRAAKLAGLDRIPAVVRHTDDASMLKEALVENIHRVQLNPLEEAAAYEQLLAEFGFTQEELATRIGKSRPAISNTLRLLTLPPAIQRRIAAGVLSAGHAKALLALEDADEQVRLGERIVAEGMSVRGVEEAVRVRLMEEPRRGSSGRGGGGGTRRLVAPGLIDLQDDLSDALEARVRISMGARKGKLTIEFGSVDDLERIVGVIAGGLSGGGPDLTLPRDEDV